jgi:hypothetical protein
MDYFDEKPFSWGWVLGSFLLFIVIEIVLGRFIGPHVSGRYLSPTLHFSLPGFLNLFSYFFGGFLIGSLSPGRRRFEPAVAAFLYLLLMNCLTFFHPHSFYVFRFVKVLIGGGLAFVLALAGAEMGSHFFRRQQFP